MNKSSDIQRKQTEGCSPFAESLSSLIDSYKVRLAKIEQAANRISEWNQDKVYKTAAAKTTKEFISELRRLQRRYIREHEFNHEVDNKIGETVVFPKSLFCRFSPENVELLKVYNFTDKAFDNCELWSDDDEVQTYKVADFNVDISKTEARFYFGVSLEYGFYEADPKKLYFLHQRLGDRTVDFSSVGSDSFEVMYRVPGSMWDFGMFIDDYLAKVMTRKRELQNEHLSKISKEKQMVSAVIDSDDELPF